MTLYCNIGILQETLKEKLRLENDQNLDSFGEISELAEQTPKSLDFYVRYLDSLSTNRPIAQNGTPTVKLRYFERAVSYFSYPIRDQHLKAYLATSPDIRKEVHLPRTPFPRQYALQGRSFLREIKGSQRLNDITITYPTSVNPSFVNRSYELKVDGIIKKAPNAQDGKGCYKERSRKLFQRTGI